jgi:hypothetical protein
LAASLQIQLFQLPILNNRDPAFLRLRDVDQHFLFHVFPDLIQLMIWFVQAERFAVGHSADKSAGLGIRPTSHRQFR